MALVQSMDVETLQKPTLLTPSGNRLGEEEMQVERQQQQQEQEGEEKQEQDGGSTIQRVDTPCPPALRRQQPPAVGSTAHHGGSYVLLPDCAERGSSRRFIALEAGQTTVVSETTPGGRLLLGSGE